MATIKRFEDIEAWILARQLCEEIGAFIDDGKFQNNYKLISQVEGSSGSIMDNIAEGFERGNRSEFLLFLGYSKGSSGEFRSQLYRAFGRKYLTAAEFEHFISLSARISAAIQQFILYLQGSNIAGLRRKESKGTG